MNDQKAAEGNCGERLSRQIRWNQGLAARKPLYNIQDKLEGVTVFRVGKVGNFVEDQGASYAATKQLKIYSVTIRREIL